ncbi:MAG: MerR family transcriptional regulator [Candidatus Omnitrophica bacterium]|nr:MerR family transcriptional regulator [Candidatus Omnitrophota bacterium]
MVTLKRKDRLKQGLLKSGEIAAKAGVLPSTIRYYSNLALIKICEYTQGRYRLFKESETLEKMSKIKEFKDKGLTLEEIRKELELPQSQTPTTGYGEEQ